MPPRFRSRLLAFALAAIVFACVAPSASARLDGPPRRDPPKPKPTLGQRAAKAALRAVGVPYRWGGSSRYIQVAFLEGKVAAANFKRAEGLP